MAFNKNAFYVVLVEVTVHAILCSLCRFLMLWVKSGISIIVHVLMKLLVTGVGFSAVWD